MINDELLAEAKKRAADRKSSVSAIVNEALRMALKGETAVAVEGTGGFQIPTYRPAGYKVVDTSPSRLDELLVAEEAEGYRK
jgi:hypothetical protein